MVEYTVFHCLISAWKSNVAMIMLAMSTSNIDRIVFGDHICIIASIFALRYVLNCCSLLARFEKFDHSTYPSCIGVMMALSLCIACESLKWFSHSPVPAACYNMIVKHHWCIYQLLALYNLKCQPCILSNLVAGCGNFWFKDPVQSQTWRVDGGHLPTVPSSQPTCCLLA